MSEPLTNPRDVAVLALRDREGNVSAHLDRLLAASRFGPVDRSFARELALGTLRRRETLLAVLKHYLARPIEELPGVLPEVLLVALYQVLFLDRVPEFAAVNEAVEQATRFNYRRQSGLVNGVLRNIVRQLSTFETGTPPVAGNIVAVGPNQFRRCERALFPDPKNKPAEYLAAAMSLPVDLAARWVQNYGPLERTVALAMQANVRAPVVLRVNALKATAPQLMERLAAAGVPVALHENGVSVVVLEHRSVIDMPGFAEGWFQPQDPTATAVGLVCAEFAMAKPGELHVLDMCAAPGTKTTHLAELMKNKGSILALDIGEAKLERINSNCQRLGVSIVTTGLAQSAGALTPGSFDLVLADVPCTNTGVLARRPEARWRFTAKTMGQTVRDQQLLVATAAQFVRPGGHLVYSTCSIEPEECGELVNRLVHRWGKCTVLREKLTLPSGGEEPTKWYDGGYCAVLRAK